MKENIKSTNMHIRVNPDVKEKAMIVLNDMGISMSDLFNMLLNQVAIQHKIPFDIIDSKYVCTYGYLHDYSNISPSPEEEYSAPFDNLDDLWRALEI
jgi:addiction module RelB/DinJ family antitoxin